MPGQLKVGTAIPFLSDTASLAANPETKRSTKAGNMLAKTQKSHPKWSGFLRYVDALSSKIQYGQRFDEHERDLTAFNRFPIYWKSERIEVPVRICFLACNFFDQKKKGTPCFRNISISDAREPG